MNDKPAEPATPPEAVAGNGLLHRRLFLTQGAALVGTGGLALLAARPAGAETLTVPTWTRTIGAPMSGYGVPSKHEGKVQRIVRPGAPGAPGTGGSRTPLELVNGTITPAGLHFERHHNGVPEIDPAQHRLVIHGKVKRPLSFTVESLLRYPTVSRIQFIECSGNSALGWAREAAQQSVGSIHGLLSCSEWTGVPLSILLDEAGVEPGAAWVLAEGADSAALSRSVPLPKAMDDAMVALWQNGERIRPEQGYPMRLFLPGFEGNMSVKWLRRLQVNEGPTMTRDETSKYSDLMPDGKAWLFTYTMGAKSLITSPSHGFKMQGPGLYEISGLAWSGAGKIRRVEVSADGGKTWGEAALTDPVLSKSLTRFRMAWRWNGGPAVLKSRAIDETGAVQPSRDELIAARGERSNYHYHGIQPWSIAATGEVTNVHA
jgi:sulfane dehydrogenase subunit SoxC